MTEVTTVNNHADMVTLLVKEGSAILETFTPEKMDMLHMAVGLSGEAAELLEGVNAGDDKNVLEECGDSEFYFEKLRRYGHPTFVYGIDTATNCPVDAVVICAGELLDLVKKHTVYNKPFDVEIFSKALSQYRVAMTSLYLNYDFGYEEACEHNMNKLLTGKNARYKAGYSDQAAQERADKA